MMVKQLDQEGFVVEATDEVNAIIAAKIISDEYVAMLEAAFWQELAAVRKQGDISTNEIARRLDAAGIASRPTTLSKLRAITHAELAENLATVGNQFREIVARIERSTPEIQEALREGRLAPRPKD
jgi:phage-related minor tail protein